MDYGSVFGSYNSVFHKIVLSVKSKFNCSIVAIDAIINVWCFSQSYVNYCATGQLSPNITKAL